MGIITKRIKSFFRGLIGLLTSPIYVIRYMLLILIFAFLSIVRKLANKLKLFHGLEMAVTKFASLLDPTSENNISKIELIDLAVQNMKAKQSRSVITIGGMTIGISAIVFLVSIGYGVQSMVVNRVARLEELKQMEISTSPNSNLYIDDTLLKVIKDFPNVEMVLPQIAVVGKINYKNSSTDMAGYGVTKDYLEQSAISPVVGKSFESNETQATFEVLTDTTTQVVTEDPVQDQVLVGNWVSVPGESDVENTLKISRLILPESLKDRQAVVNRAFLKVLSINESEAIGLPFSVAFIATGKVLAEGQDRIESKPAEYTIVGVTPDDKIPLFYVPFIHLKSLGINNYSQAKIVVKDEKSLQGVRSLAEAQGFTTISVVDTVAQINSLFETVRTVLALVGTIALFVAALGMFNTLTVSLLERTREIGLLKSMGMKSSEIRDSFLAESMIMGSLGGIMGITVGFVLGKILELILSIVAIKGGLGWISMVDIPVSFGLLIIFVSFSVGVFTGIYPARRATKISALNALRYE